MSKKGENFFSFKTYYFSHPILHMSKKNRVPVRV